MVEGDHSWIVGCGYGPTLGLSLAKEAVNERMVEIGWCNDTSSRFKPNKCINNDISSKDSIFLILSTGRRESYVQHRQQLLYSVQGKKVVHWEWITGSFARVKRPQGRWLLLCTENTRGLCKEKMKETFGKCRVYNKKIKGYLDYPKHKELKNRKTGNFKFLVELCELVWCKILMHQCVDLNRVFWNMSRTSFYTKTKDRKCDFLFKVARLFLVFLVKIGYFAIVTHFKVWH